MIMTDQNQGRSKQKSPLLKPTIVLLVKNVVAHDVDKSAAALAYYLMFALFPLLIFVNNLLGLLDLNVAAIIRVLYQFLPRDIVQLVEDYLDYVSNTSSKTLLWFALIFSVWFPMRAVKGLMNDVRLAYQLDKPQRPLAYTVRQLLFTIVFLLAMVLTLLFSILGQNVVSLIVGLLPDDVVQISEYLLSAWQYVRFLPAGLFMLAAIVALYAGSLDSRQSIKTILPGGAGALAAWMVVSIIFSFYVENFANYSVIYGTLGTVMVLLLWLYLTAVILILGAELNAALLAVRSDRIPDAQQ